LCHPNTASGYPEVWVEHGHVDGKKQLTHDIVSKGVNEGKANETTPLQQAALTMERKIIKQKEKGYADKIVNKETNYLYLPFPKELCFYKPQNSIDDKKIAALESAKRAIFTVKRDGMMHVVGCNATETVIYSRRMDAVGDKFPHLMEAFKGLPDNTILLGEMVLINTNGKDDFNSVSRICRSDVSKAIARQEELGKLQYYIFDIVQYLGRNILTNGYSERLKIIRDIVNKHINSKYVLAPEVIAKPHKDALKEVQKRGLEGLVVWDAKGIMKANEAFTMNGKAYRPNVLWKSKLKYRDDFIAKFLPDQNIGEYGRGKNKHRVGSVFLYQIDKEGKEFYVGKCGGGLTDEQREFYANTGEWPRCWEVEYDSIQPGTGSLRFPVFVRDRTLNKDKNTEECIISEDIQKAIFG